MVLEHRRLLETNGHLNRRRRAQAIEWMQELIAGGLQEGFRRDPRIAERLPALQAAVEQGRTSPLAASSELLTLFHSKQR